MQCTPLRNIVLCRMFRHVGMVSHKNYRYSNGETDKLVNLPNSFLYPLIFLAITASRPPCWCSLCRAGPVNRDLLAVGRGYTTAVLRVATRTGWLSGLAGLGGWMVVLVSTSVSSCLLITFDCPSLVSRCNRFSTIIRPGSRRAEPGLQHRASDAGCKCPMLAFG